MKKSIVCLSFLFCLVLTLMADTPTIQEESVTGKWSFSVPEAPYGYQSGTLEIIPEGAKLTGELTINCSIIKIHEIKKNEDSYSCNLYVDGQEVKLRVRAIDGKLIGIADAGGGWQFPVSLTRPLPASPKGEK